MKSMKNNNFQEYRNRLASVLNTVRHFNGTETSYHDSMRKMIGLEKWLCDTFNEKETPRLQEEAEKTIAAEAGINPNRTISGLLDLMKGRLEKVLEDKDSVLVVDLNGIILPPGDVPIVEGHGQKVERQEIRFDQRWKKLLKILQQNGIFIDDIISYQGTVTPNMMRKDSYYLVEIPRIRKMILVCDQIGEATFVIDGLIPRNQILKLSKEQLQNSLGEMITRIVFQNEDQWEKQIIATLNLEEGLGEKIDVRLMNAIRAQVSTAEEWVGMRHLERTRFKVNGMGLYAISGRFGIEGDPRNNNKYHFELGKLIYGENPVFEYDEKVDISNDELKELIQAQVPTPEQWARMKYGERLKFKVNGIGFKAIARKFGVEGDLRNNNKYLLELGKLIYGDASVFNVIDLGVEELKELIQAQVPTPEQWARMKSRERFEFKVNGMGLTTISTRFGVDGNPISNNKYHLELGKLIYGESSVFEYDEKVEISNEELIELIKAQVPTADQWAEMKAKEKAKFKVNGLGLRAMAGRFGIEGDPRNYNKYHLELGKLIYGESSVFEYEEKVEISNKELKELIKAQVPTADQWLGMQARIRRDLKVNGFGLTTIASKFGVDRYSIGNYQSHLALGKKIYGENPIFDIKETLK